LKLPKLLNSKYSSGCINSPRTSLIGFRQESAIRKKRRERDATLKQQAESAGKKRRRGEDAEEGVPEHVAADKAADMLALESAEVASLGSADADADADDQHGDGNESLSTSAPTKLTSRSVLPDFLPEEYLQDEESDDDMAIEITQPMKRAKKTKFTDLVEKKPKDRRVGSTTYRVAEACNTKLAPKASFQARSVKELWMQGRSASGAAPNRKPFSSGFFKAK
jgi:U3 small nucleolar RNA-associated protein 16